MLAEWSICAVSRTIRVPKVTTRRGQVSPGGATPGKAPELAAPMSCAGPERTSRVHRRIRG